MGFGRLKWYSPSGKHIDPDAWFLYAAFFKEPLTGTGLVKIGISRTPFRRLGDIHCNCPYPIERAIFTSVGHGKLARGLESMLKQRWLARRTRGEWFRFDFRNAEDKEDFNNTMRGCFQRATNRKLAWTEVAIEEVVKAVRNPLFEEGGERGA